jgi:pimeloyl-ACP methyl ester carboxylesterase
MTSLLYLHGFADGPKNPKGRYCHAWAKAHGIVFHAPDLNVPTFESLTISAQVDAVETLIQQSESSPVLVGSSLGGLVAVAAAHRANDQGRARLKALILLAPAFGFARRRLESDLWAGYRLRGNLPVWHFAKEHWARLGPQLLEDLPAWTREEIRRVEAPIFVLHGRRDEIVPVEESEAFVSRQPDARLLILDDDHDLSATPSMDALSGILTQVFNGHNQ